MTSRIKRKPKSVTTKLQTGESFKSCPVDALTTELGITLVKFCLSTKAIPAGDDKKLVIL